jgi:hypothetical protein
MADYMAMLSHLTNLNSISPFTQNQIILSRQFIRHLPMNTCSEDIALALQELGFYVINVKQMTAKRPSPEGSKTKITLPPIPSDPGTQPKFTKHI